MDGDARSKVGYRRGTGENMLSSRFTAYDPFRTSIAPFSGLLRIRSQSELGGVGEIPMNRFLT
jgi:hypothetical protein